MPYTPTPRLSELSLKDIENLCEGRKLPPVQSWNPEASSDSKMRILRNCKWLHDGGEITRIAMIRAFSTLLRKDEDGYWLVTPYEKQSIIVEDAPFMALEMSVNGTGQGRQITLRLNEDSILTIGSKNEIMMFASGEDMLPYVHVRSGLWAKCNRNVTYELYEMALADQDDNGGMMAIWSGGTCFEIGANL